MKTGKCRRCEGTGVIEIPHPPFWRVTKVECTRCNGTGELAKIPKRKID